MSIDGKLIKGSPFDIKVRTDETVAGNCKALGAGLQGGCVGDHHAFTVQAVDGKGNARTIGGDAYRVTANGTPGQVVDHMNGTYTATWSSTVAADNVVAVTLDGEHISGSPFACTLSPGELAAAQCEANGDGLHTARAGEPASFVVTARDRFGNRRNDGELGTTSTSEEDEVTASTAGRHASSPLYARRMTLVRSLGILPCPNEPPGSARLHRFLTTRRDGRMDSIARRGHSGVHVRAGGGWAVGGGRDGRRQPGGQGDTSIQRAVSADVQGQPAGELLAGRVRGHGGGGGHTGQM